MNRVYFLFNLMALMTVGTLVSFAGNSGAKHVTKHDADPLKSMIEWTGTKVTGSHSGTINVKSGFVMNNHGSVAGGEFVIDMTSLKNTDMKDPKGVQNLESHLKSEDFFNVEKFPTATLKLKKVEKAPAGTGVSHLISADLTIKGITNEITFPANLKFEESGLSGIADIIIDRTKWDIKYGSASFFDNLGDKAISNEISFKVKIHTN